MKLWMMAIAAACLALFFLFFFYLDRPAGTTGRENGTFENDCCGTLVLRDGGMLLNDRQVVRYTVGQDSHGPYILPRTYVGAFEDKGFEVDGTRPPIRLRLDRLPRPGLVLLREGRQVYAFKRADRPPRR